MVNSIRSIFCGPLKEESTVYLLLADWKVNAISWKEILML
jgi:hypothetical protein